MVKTVWDLAPNESSRIKYLLEDELVPAMSDLGCIPGATVKLIRRTVLNGPVYVQVNDNFLAIRQKEAKLIVVEDQ